MTVKDVLDVLAVSNRLIIKQDKELKYSGYIAEMDYEDKAPELMKAEVKKLTLKPEVTHKQYKEKGLLAPVYPEDTPAYEFKDLTLRLYYVIDI